VIFSEAARLGLRLLSVVVALVILSGCAHQPIPTGENEPGVFMRLVQGLLFPLSFCASLFTDARIYAFPNAGVWYDFGYVLGALMWSGGTSVGSCMTKPPIGAPDIRRSSAYGAATSLRIADPREPSSKKFTMPL
jgi:hypothetical protein